MNGTSSEPRSRRDGLAFARIARVRVGSQKAPKIEAVRSALAAFVADVVIDGVAVESGVSEQPVGLEEIAAGARNRARRAFALPGECCDLAFGIEDGLVLVTLDGKKEVFNIGCAVVTDGRRESIGLSSGFAYPPECTAPALANRADIGTVFDRLWQRYEAETTDAPSAAGTGNIGKLTLGVLPRSEYGRHAVVCALVRFLHPSLYFDPEANGQFDVEANGRFDVEADGQFDVEADGSASQRGLA